MRILIFFVITAFMAGSSHCYMSVECYSLRELECQEYDVSKHMPNNIEDLKNICSNVIILGNCMLGVMEKCAADENMIHDTEANVEKFRDVMKFFESACDEDSQIFTAIADNLNCVTSTLKTMDDICVLGGLNDTTREKLYNMIQIEHQHCIIDTWIFYYLTTRLDVECGSRVKYASREILDNTDYVSPHCKNIKNDFSYFKEAFKSEFRQGKRGQEAVPGIMAEIAKSLE